MLAPSEADSLVPLCKEIIRGGRVRSLGADEPLLFWFGTETAVCLRAIEQSIRRCLVGTKTQSNLAPFVQHGRDVLRRFVLTVSGSHICLPVLQSDLVADASKRRPARFGGAQRHSVSVHRKDRVNERGAEC